MTILNAPDDSDAMALAAFKEEGAFLLSADRAAEALVRRVEQAQPTAEIFVLTRDEMQQLAADFTRAVAIGKEYHIDSAGLAA
jgi:hypothetical protein